MHVPDDMMQEIFGEQTKDGRDPETTRRIDEATTHSVDAYWEYTSGSVQRAYDLIVQAQEKLEIAQRLIENSNTLEEEA